MKCVGAVKKSGLKFLHNDVIKADKVILLQVIVSKGRTGKLNHGVHLVFPVSFLFPWQYWSVLVPCISIVASEELWLI